MTAHQNQPSRSAGPGDPPPGATPAPAAESLVVRQHERLACALRADLAVAPDHAGALEIARHVADGEGRVGATCTDVSRGGLGLRSSVFFPKHALLRVRLPETDGCWEGLVRVERVTMIDRGPTYYLGTSGVQPAPDAAPDAAGRAPGRLEHLLELVRRPAAGRAPAATQGVTRA